MGNYTNAFGRVVRTVRAAQGMTQKQLAGRVGVSPSVIAAYERGVRSPSWRSALAIADALGVTLDQLAGRAPVEI